MKSACVPNTTSIYGNRCLGLAVTILVSLFPPAARADYVSTILQDNPVAYYRLDEPEGAEMTVDATDHGLNSSEIDGARFGRVGVCGGSAVEFDGNDSILLGLTMNPADPRGDGNGGFSIETWINFDRRGEIGIVTQQDGSGTGRGNLAMDFNSRLNSWLVKDGLSSGFRPDLDTWYHVVMSADTDDDSVYFYIDGEPAGRNPVSMGGWQVEDADGQWVLGSHKSRSFQFFRGLLDEVAIYDYRLDDPNGDNNTSDSRVASHFAACNASSIGDFDGDGELTVADMDLLSTAVRAMLGDAKFDLDGNGSVDDEDRSVFVHELKNSYFGDANLDGEFNTTDLIAVFQAGKYEQDTDSGWGEGDWSGDQRFESGDLVVAFGDGGFERGPRLAVQAVPEPTGILPLALAIVAASPLLRRGFRRKRNRLRKTS